MKASIPQTGYIAFLKRRGNVFAKILFQTFNTFIFDTIVCADCTMSYNNVKKLPDAW